MNEQFPAIRQTLISGQKPAILPTLDEKGETVFQGVVAKNDKGCEVDGWCLLEVTIEENVVLVVYHFGEWPPCENDGATTEGFSVSVGDRVEIYGAVYEGQTISTCADQRFYIQKLPANP